MDPFLMDFWGSFQEFEDPEYFHQFWHAPPAPAPLAPPAPAPPAPVPPAPPAPAPPAPVPPAPPMTSDAQDQELQLALEFEDILATLESDFIKPPQETMREEIPSPVSPLVPLEPSVDDFMQGFNKSLEVVRVAFQKIENNFQASPKKRKRTPNAVKLFPAEKRQQTVLGERSKKRWKANGPVPPSHHAFPHHAPANLGTPLQSFPQQARGNQVSINALPAEAFDPHYLALNYQAPAQGQHVGSCTMNGATFWAIPFEDYLNLGPHFKKLVQLILMQPAP